MINSGAVPAFFLPSLQIYDNLPNAVVFYSINLHSLCPNSFLLLTFVP